MPDQPHDSGVKKPVNTDSCPATGFVRTNPYCQTIETGTVDKEAQSYRGPEFRSGN